VIDIFQVLTGTDADSIVYDCKEKRYKFPNGQLLVGLVMAKITCPQNLEIPFLQFRSKITGRTTTPVCKQCADNESLSCSHGKK
jgi:hypothetical protein